ncbi:hypothetical protein [Brevibacterium casei]|uniref:hypothetical protein n=1 Tax=Brevibacterium casei TaxID=33889 RepID=UPI000C76C1AA|nr:hypothetical protein [Brevibacterium casei]QPR39564.1 hypothetical protein I6G94_01315 [Brevibacterium casei]QPR43729.1 hypothetical protein I6G93_16605 [Brevibacterium casei]
MSDQPIFYKATRPDGTDFYSGTVDYAGAVGGDPIVLPVVDAPECCSSTVLHAATVPTETLIGGSWPCRLFEVTGEPVANEEHKRGFFSLTVVREIDAHLALGPQGREIAALIERSGALTQADGESLRAAWGAARRAAWGAAWDAAWGAARRAARRAARDAARRAAWDAARDGAWAIVVRDLIGQHGLTQDHYDTLTRPWRTVIGRIHPDDADLMGDDDA